MLPFFARNLWSTCVLWDVSKDLEMIRVVEARLQLEKGSLVTVRVSEGLFGGVLESRDQLKRYLSALS